MIVGIIFGILVLVLAIIGGVVLYRRYKNMDNANQGQVELEEKEKKASALNFCIFHFFFLFLYKNKINQDK